MCSFIIRMQKFRLIQTWKWRRNAIQCNEGLCSLWSRSRLLSRERVFSWYAAITYARGRCIFCLHEINEQRIWVNSVSFNYTKHNCKFSYALREMYKPGMSELEILLYQMDQLILEHSSELANHFNAQGFATSTFASRWFLTLFSAVFPKVH